MVDYEKVDKAVEELQKLHPDMPHYILWVLATDYYINEEKAKDEEDNDILAQEGSPARRENTRARDKAQELKKEALEAYERAKEELKTTRYESIKIEA
jgi:hypothetical protein